MLGTEWKMVQSGSCEPSPNTTTRAQCYTGQQSKVYSRSSTYKWSCGSAIVLSGEIQSVGFDGSLCNLFFYSRIRCCLCLRATWPPFGTADKFFGAAENHVWTAESLLGAVGSHVGAFSRPLSPRTSHSHLSFSHLPDVPSTGGFNNRGCVFQFNTVTLGCILAVGGVVVILG